MKKYLVFVRCTNYWCTIKVASFTYCPSSEVLVSIARDFAEKKSRSVSYVELRFGLKTIALIHF